MNPFRSELPETIEHALNTNRTHSRVREANFPPPASWRRGFLDLVAIFQHISRPISFGRPLGVIRSSGDSKPSLRGTKRLSGVGTRQSCSYLLRSTRWLSHAMFGVHADAPFRWCARPRAQELCDFVEATPRASARRCVFVIATCQRMFFTLAILSRLERCFSLRIVRFLVLKVVDRSEACGLW